MSETTPIAEFLAVRAGGHIHALRVGQVVEVVKPLPIAELPRVPGYLKGAAQFRSEVIPVIELAGRIGLLAVANTAGLKSRLVVVDAARGRAGILVDEIVGVWRDGAVEGQEVVRRGQRVPIVDLDRAVDWRAG